MNISRPEFMELTSTTGQKVQVNLNAIGIMQRVHTAAPEYTRLQVGPQYLDVQETPEEILARITLGGP